MQGPVPSLEVILVDEDATQVGVGVPGAKDPNGVDRTKYVAYFGPHFLSYCIVFICFCVTYGLYMCDCRHLSISDVGIAL